MAILSEFGKRPMHQRYERQKRVLIDGMRDAHILLWKEKGCIALERTWRYRCRGGLD